MIPFVLAFGFGLSLGLRLGLGLSLGPFGLVLALGLAWGLALAFGLVSAFGLALGLVLVLGLSLAFGLFLVFASDFCVDSNNKIIALAIAFYLIGACIGGYIGYQQNYITALQANTIATTTIPNTYQGVVEAIYTNHPSSITFTSGQTWQGNVSRVKNLSVGAVCTLTQNSSMGSWVFINGTCR